MVRRKEEQCNPVDHPDKFLMDGYKLKQAAAAKLELKLKADPFDLSCRLELLGYFFKTCHSSKLDARKQLGIVVWMIKKIPEHRTLGQPWAAIHKFSNPKGYEKCKKLWLEQVAKKKDNVAVIINAAKFLRDDPRIAEKLYRRAIELEPKKAEWSRNLAWFLRLSAPQNSRRMEKALVAMQDAVRKTKEPARRWYLYDDLAEIAFDVGEWSIAERAAQKCVSLAREFRGDWNEGNAIHNGNCILGLLALRKGDLKAAKLRLSKAGKTCGSPQLGSFGPQLRFAQQMLRAGERESVISYLEACKLFWRKQEKLREYIIQIKNGKSPRLDRYC